jgi:hypothetical protein
MRRSIALTRPPWAKQVIEDKAKKARVLQTGDPPRQVLGAPLAVGEALDADVVVSSSVKLRAPGGAVPERRSPGSTDAKLTKTVQRRPKVINNPCEIVSWGARC